MRVKLVGRKSELTKILRSMRDVAPEDRREVGQKVNQLRDLFNKKLNGTKDQINKALVAEKLQKEKKLMLLCQVVKLTLVQNTQSILF